MWSDPWIREAGTWIAWVLGVGVSLFAAVHAVLNKRDVRSAIGWFVVIWLVVPVGAVLYALLGVNRVRRKGRSMRAAHPRLSESDMQALPTHADAWTETDDHAYPDFDASSEHLQELVAVVGRLEVRPLVSGNHVDMLINGEACYPAMLEAISNAEHSVSLATYIFEADEVGASFVEALSSAVKRGVEVRVLVDAAGMRYGRTGIHRELRRAGVTVALFSQGLLRPHMNLRMHRKVLVVDGRVGFTGGMNIRQGHLVDVPEPNRIADAHFRVEGPVVHQLQSVFVDDWQFTTNEALRGDTWFPTHAAPTAGAMVARALPDGPDEDFNKMRLTIQGALCCAEKSVKIMTPYFLPDAALVDFLSVAAMRGVEVQIIVPCPTNIALAEWASTAQLRQVANEHCQVFRTSDVFEHTKMMIVDDEWVLVGSGNWDARSLRLNFECNLECYDKSLARQAGAYFATRLQAAKRVQRSDVEDLPFWIRVRNGLARLLLPYL